MALKLISKKAPRGALLRSLTEEEEGAINRYVGERHALELREHELAERIVLEMRQTDAWLQCDCVPDDSPALNSAGLVQDTRTLYLKGFNHPHALHCPMYRPFKGDEGATSSGTRKTAGSTRINYRNFLPADETGARLQAPGRPTEANADRTRRKKRSSIARLLLSLIEDAGLNRLETLSPLPTRQVRDSLTALREVAQTHEFMRGRFLDEIVRFTPGMGANARETLMQELENTNNRWPARKARVFYQIFMSGQVTRDSATFTWPTGETTYTPERGVSINGEALEGNRPPYWVILAFRRGINGDVICSEGYAHALFDRRTPVPVDSELERQTLRSIVTTADWLKTKPEAPVMTLYRPLFDIEVEVLGEKGYVLPDFIITATAPDEKTYQVVIETMGYTDDDYCERKSEQHVGMRRVGIFQTDPPQWPDETSKSFTNNLYGVMHHLEELEQKRQQVG